ncbi:response regulator [uncultured Thiodictyon sp.]|uniref:response regulator n=1 Tax=uncultured Thiodictyon sp. TaxID=1846217 RepID=UPI0025DF5E20|nr:response regulator [uncultured Thiodictyon sp.]
MNPFSNKSGSAATDSQDGSRHEALDRPAAGGATVLVVDDSPTETRIFINTLSQAGYKVETATDGEQGVEMARRLRPDVILMDVIMPTLNGFQATRVLHKDAATANIPIIMVTTKDQPTDRTWGLRQGAVEYLVKPVAPAALLECVRAVLQR